MSNSENSRAPGEMVAQHVLGLANVALAGAAKVGDRGAFWQAFDQNDDPEHAEVQEQTLSPEQAREVLAARVLSGFVGVVQYTAIVGQRLLVAEGYDTRTDYGLTVTCRLKRTFSGKYKQTEQLQIVSDGRELIDAIEKRRSATPAGDS